MPLQSAAFVDETGQQRCRSVRPGFDLSSLQIFSIPPSAASLAEADGRRFVETSFFIRIQNMTDAAVLETVSGIDPDELAEWNETLEDVLQRYGPDRLRELLVHLQERAYQRGVMLPFTANTPYINTIHHSKQPAYPGDMEIERRIKSLVRWNALAMEHGGN